MAKGQVRSSKEKRKPKANAKKKGVGLAPSQPDTGPSEMYKLFTKARHLG